MTKAIGSDGRALWEDFFPLEKLEDIRAEAGTIIFGLQYQNDATLAKGAIFKPTDFRFHDRAPDGLDIYQGVDLAISKKETADYFTIVTIGFCKRSGDYFVLDSMRGRLSFARQADLVVETARRWKPRRVGIESTAYQAALADYITDVSEVPVKKVSRSTDKVMRAWKLSALFEAGRVFFRRADTLLADELASFPDAGHDDLFDALETAVSLARSDSRKSQGFKYIQGI